MQTADLNSIYNLLFAGSKLQLSFEDAQAAEYFRVRMAQFKARQEASLLSLGFLEESQILSFSFKKAKQSGGWIAEFVPRRQPPVFTILVLEDDKVQITS